MKKILSLILVSTSLIFASCGINDTKSEIENLAKCKFEIKSIKEMNIAGTPLDKIAKNGNLDLGRLPNIAIAALQKNIPLDAVVNLEIQNPTDKKASIDEFDYIILFENHELAKGVVDQEISVAAKETSIVPIKIEGEIYNLIFGNDKALLNFLLGDNSAKANFTIKVKPTFTIAGQKIKYPGYISIDKQLSREILFK